jgi:hypothetical protein
MAGLVFDTGHPLELDIKKRDEPNVHPAFELARIIAEEGLPFKFAEVPLFSSALSSLCSH